MKTKHKFSVQNNKIIYHNPERLTTEIKKYSEGWLTVSDNKPSRSNQQNAYYWGVVVKILSSETGYTPDEMHEVLKFKFLGTREISFKGEKIPTLNDSKSLKTNEFEEYLTKIREWASAELSIYIPTPNEVSY